MFLFEERTLESDGQIDPLSCLAWHDYENPSYPDLTRYLKNLSNQLPMYHVEETMICFYLKNAPSSLTGKLIHSDEITAFQQLPRSPM